MEPGELMMSGAKARSYIGQMRGVYQIHPHTLRKAIKERGLPSHFDPFGVPGKLVFYPSEINAWLKKMAEA